MVILVGCWLVTYWARGAFDGTGWLVGDEVGSALIGGRLVRDIMRLCFLMERTYAPYQKWFGTAFKRLSCGPDLWPMLQNALQAETWRD